MRSFVFFFFFFSSRRRHTRLQGDWSSDVCSSDRDAQRREVASGSRFWTGKNIPGFGPLGPEIITMDEIRDAYDLWMTCSVNGQERMRVNTRDQIWKLPVILEHFSRYIPFEPGDLFSTGAPGGVTYIV